MPGTYKLFTAIVAIIGNISLISTGEINPVFSLAGCGLLWGYYRSMRGRPSLPKWAVGSLTFMTFITFLIDAISTGDIFLAVGRMTLLFQTLKSFDIKEPWDPLQVFFVSLLQLLMASELSTAISFGMVFLVFLVCIVVSILLGHFVKEGQHFFKPFLGPVVFITMLTLVLTAVFFVAVPRFQSGLWGKSFLKGIKTAGFSEHVDFGSFGEIKLDTTVVMRVILRPELNEPLYLRGMTFDHFDGSAWNDRIKERKWVRRSERNRSVDTSQKAGEFHAEIYLEPLDSDVIFTIKKPYNIDSPGYYMRKDAAGSFYMKHKISKRFFYRMYSTDAHAQDDSHLASYLQFPEDASSIARLSETLTIGSPEAAGKAAGIRDYLMNNFEYSLETEEPDDGSSVIEHFLFTSKTGYCEHFATSMTLMLRSVGIPARLVTGYTSSSKNKYGNYYIIQQSDAHSWVEAFINGRWEMFDPTPVLVSSVKPTLLLLLDTINLNWYQYVVGFSSYDQIRITRFLFGFSKPELKLPPQIDNTLVIVFAALAIIYGFISIRRRRASVTCGGVSAEYLKFRKRVSGYGGSILPSSSTNDVMKEAIETGRFDTIDVHQFIDGYRFLRFSGRSDRDTLKNYYQLSKRLVGKKQT